jgi:hypothetical protein
MLKRSMLATLIAIALCGGVANAQENRAYTRFLIPVYTGEIPGAFGSRWQSRTWIHYSGTELAIIVPRAGCYGIMCTPEGTLGPGEPSLPYQQLAGFPEPAILVHVESAYADDVTFATRVRDLTRLADTAGTAIPVVREDRMPAGPVYLLDIPVDRRFRQTLRLYALPEVENPEVTVRYFRQPDASGFRIDLDIHLLRTDRVTLRRHAPGFPVNYYPALAEIGNIDLMPELAGEKTIWVEVAPVTAGLRIWALMSVTNNDTQQVTIITPKT